MTDRSAQRPRRGHQYHPKNIGIRTSNVPTTEIIQALRDGRNLETLFQHHSQPIVSNQVDVTGSTDFTTSSEVLFDDESHADKEYISKIDLKNKENLSSSSQSSQSDNNIDKLIKNSDSKKRKIRTANSDIVKIVCSTDDNDDDDAETAELAKLRCTSERAEVIAERENRRQKKCADYPGLAFGRSIFSSDSMMKFNIIRNELQNIMNNQLRRVRCGHSHRTFFF
jgi:hypothetical protein